MVSTFQCIYLWGGLNFSLLCEGFAFIQAKKKDTLYSPSVQKGCYIYGVCQALEVWVYIYYWRNKLYIVFWYGGLVKRKTEMWIVFFFLGLRYSIYIYNVCTREEEINFNLLHGVCFYLTPVLNNEVLDTCGFVEDFGVWWFGFLFSDFISEDVFFVSILP